MAGDTNAVERLLRAPCVRVDERHDGWTALHKAAEAGATAIVRGLLQAGAQTGARIDNPYKDFTPLQLSADRGHADVVRLLLEAGVDTEETGRRGTPLELAVWGGHREVVQVLRHAGARTEFMRGKGLGTQPLHEAARTGKVEVVKLLIDLGANVNNADSSGATPLLNAVEARRGVEVVKLLLAAGAQVNFKNGNPLEGVITACKQDDQTEERGEPSKEPGLLKIAKVLIDAGARLDHVAGEGESRKTAIGLASEYGQADVVKFLLKAGAKVNETDGRGETAFMRRPRRGPRSSWRYCRSSSAQERTSTQRGLRETRRSAGCCGQAPRIPRAGSGTWRFY